MTKDEALKLALEALENAEYGGYDKEELNKAITIIKEALAQPDPYKQGYADAMNWKVQNHLEHLPTAQPEQEPVAWGVDWGKAGDIPCVSIIKRLPDGGSQIMAVEYAPYSYTTPPKQEPVAIMREMLEVQGQHGNWNYDSYMHGLYNGMEYMVALAEKREPKFRDAPDDWLAKYEVKRDNFNSTEPLTEATPPKQEPVKYSDYEPDGVHHNKPPQRKPMTEEFIMDSTRELSMDVRWPSSFIDVWRLCEATHGVKK